MAYNPFVASSHTLPARLAVKHRPFYASVVPPSPPAPDAELNPPQAAAVAHVDGPLLVFAGAGSGKTRVITYRIANLVACERVPAYRILAVTFTNKAAGEMRDRLGRLLGEDLARELWVGTFHAISAKLLRRHGEALGLPKNFVIYDTDDQKAVVNRALRSLDLDEKRYPPRLCLAAIHKEKQELRGPDDMDVGDPWLPKIFRAYDEQLRAAKAVDFEDLIGLMVRLLEENPNGAGDALLRRFSYVLVDEFQDTNAAQYRFLKAFARDHRNLCVVGDDDQSIYRWRGADVRNIRGFKRDFPDAQVVKLEQNYRSTARIVKAALGVIEKSRERVPKELWTANAEGAPIDVVATRDERDEAAYVLSVIQEARLRGVDPKEIAVFYRVHAQSRVLEEALLAGNVPYQIVGGIKFYDRAEVKNAIAYLRVLMNPSSDIDLLRVINTPARGIGATTVERLTALARAEGVSLAGAIAIVGAPHGAGDVAAKRAGLGAAAVRLYALSKLLEGLRKDMETMRPSELLSAVLDRSGYLDALKAEDTPEAEARLENLAELTSSVFDYEQEAAAAGDTPSVAGYLERVSLQSDVDGMKDASRVTLMTVHGAKGLEFELVLLTGMEQDMFPYRGMTSGEHDTEEERRLAYVAITRARSRLIMTHTDTRQIFGTTRLGGPSPFLALIPNDALRLVSTPARGSSRLGRFVDREDAPRTRRGEWEHPQGPDSYPPPSSRWRPPARVVASDIAPGERYVDREFFDDSPASGDLGALGLRRGSRVVHSQFGEGEVRGVVQANEPAVLVAFPGRGEKKILARFLRLA
jgi:DNA helicase-2/ATP-dependent DNA helicase PcrA